MKPQPQFQGQAGPQKASSPPATSGTRAPPRPSRSATNAGEPPTPRTPTPAATDSSPPAATAAAEAAPPPSRRDSDARAALRARSRSTGGGSGDADADAAEPALGGDVAATTDAAASKAAKAASDTSPGGAGANAAFDPLAAALLLPPAPAAGRDAVRAADGDTPRLGSDIEARAGGGPGMRPSAAATIDSGRDSGVGSAAQSVGAAPAGPAGALAAVAAVPADGAFAALLAERRDGDSADDRRVAGVAGAATVAAHLLAFGAAASPGGATASGPIDLGAAVGSPGFAPQLGAQVSVLVRDGIQHAELHLNPADMGPVSVQITMDGSQARVEFGADVLATRQAIEAGLPALASALADAGFTLAGGGVSQHARGGGGHGGSGRGADERATGRFGGGASPEALDAGTASGRTLRRSVSVGGVDLYA